MKVMGDVILPHSYPQRTKRKVPTLKRSACLDTIAHEHAQTMAEHQSVHNSVQTAQELQTILKSEHVGENVQRGKSVFAMHETCMKAFDSIHRRNILSAKFTEFGMGTAKGPDGLLYMVQLFRSSPLQLPP